jgi:putative ABC transport system permease protein
MRFARHFRTALAALRLNLVRSILTTLGVIIGVASLIIMVSIGAGAQSAIDKQIAGLGSNMLQIQSGPGGPGGGRREAVGAVQMLTERDIRALRDQVPSIVAISGQVSSSAPLVYGNANWTAQVQGVGAEFLEIRDWPVVAGRGFETGDMTVGAKVALVGQTVVRELFEGADPVGAEMRIRNVPFTVVGVLDAKGQAGFGRDQDDVVLVPLPAARARLQGGRSRSAPDAVHQIFVEFASAKDMLSAAEDIDAVLRARRQLSAGDEAPFSVRNTAELIRTRTEAQATMAFLLGATSVISLIVGGIGIMNIMLVSVTERTREIGLRMAVGARKRDILAQFLIETVTLCLIGGALGIALGVGGSYAIAALGDWPILLRADTIVLGIAASIAVGVVFGLLPSRRAASLNPIEALRHE